MERRVRESERLGRFKVIGLPSEPTVFSLLTAHTVTCSLRNGHGATATELPRGGQEG